MKQAIGPILCVALIAATWVAENVQSHDRITFGLLALWSAFGIACGCLYMGGTTAYNTYIKGAIARNMQQEYKSDTTDDGYDPTAAMLDGGPWDDAEMYGLYIN